MKKFLVLEQTSIPSNSNSDGFSDEGFDLSKGLMHSKQYQTLGDMQSLKVSIGQQTPKRKLVKEKFGVSYPITNFSSLT